MKNLPEARVARLAECHKEQKAGYDQHASPQTTKGSEKANVASTALKYWQDELATKEETTRTIYEKKFADILRFINKNPDELIVQRQHPKHHIVQLGF